MAQIVSRAPPRDLYQEFQSQNSELVEALADLRRSQAELAQVNRELEETNRGVLALYAELEEQARSLSRTNEQKTRFYSGVSHEFRTPITSILSLSQILLDRLDGELTVEQERQISLIRRCGQNLLEWVNDRLDLARVDAGRIDLRLSEFSLHDLMTGLRGIMRPLVTSDHVALVFEDAPGLAGVSLYSDEGKLAQVLRNFISNALKFTERGEVRLAAEIAPSCDDSVCFQVSDTGIGIAAGDIDRIFDEFVQVENALQRQARGTGLGLPLSRRLAGLLGGTISVSSAVGEGSTFQLVVPRRLSPRGEDGDVKSPAARADSRQSGDLNGRPLILIVDDDEASRYLLQQVLASFPVSVQNAADGYEALKLAEDLAPQLVFLDLGLPGLSGFEVLESLKHASATREIPVVIYTSQDVDVENDSRLKGQVLAVLYKPSGEEGPPVERIRDALERSRVIDGSARRGHP